MSKHRARPPLRIRPRPSRSLAAFVALAYGATLSLVFVIPLGWYWRALLAVVVLSGLSYAFLAQVLYLVPRAVREAAWASDGTWTLTLVSGKRIEARLLPSTYVTERLLVLNFRCGSWQHRALVLLPDALEGELLRRLRVRLRLFGVQSDAGTDALA